jgi:hypothetical protein
VINALLVTLFPAAAWKRIVEDRPGIPYVLCTYLLPLLAITSAAEGYGLAHYGKKRSSISQYKTFPLGDAIVIEAFEFLLYLVVVVVGAWLVKSLGETFHGRHTYRQTFTAVAYGLAPLLLFRALDVLPFISPYVSWAIGIFLSIASLYNGLPAMMEPDPPHAFGLWLMSALLLLVVTGLAQALFACYLDGRFPRLEPFISGLGDKLPL